MKPKMESNPVSETLPAGRRTAQVDGLRPFPAESGAACLSTAAGAGRTCSTALSAVEASSRQRQQATG
jgi:hypothetical protein